jgi:ATP-dependent Clp protease ATP-binding subunit ClpA
MQQLSKRCVTIGDDPMPTFSRSLEQSLHRALALANERHHEYAALEHLLLALVDDQDAAAVMRACNVDVEKLRRNLASYIESEGRKPPGVVLRQLTEEERTARAQALADSKVNPEAVDAEPLLQFFADEHLPEHLQEHSKPFGDLARRLVETLPSNPERTMALRKLLEAKDCAVRAKLFK